MAGVAILHHGSSPSARTMSFSMLPRSHSYCITACRDCIAACESWLERVPAIKAGRARQHCAELCRSSIRLCQLVIEELGLRSSLSFQVCALGTVICRACAEECAAANEA